MRKVWVRTLVLALVGLLVGAQGVSTAELVFRVERVTGDLWAKGWIETDTGFKFPDGSIQTTAANGNGWSLTGNEIASGQFLGTINNQALNIVVNNVRAFRIKHHATSPNIIGGWHGNTVTAGRYGATISGGGSSGNINQVTASCGTVGGGRSNTASGFAATVAGGEGNEASGGRATVSGGQDNTASRGHTTVSGGRNNIASDLYATVSGGHFNEAESMYATVGGGIWNTASGYAATVGGGISNTAAGDYGFVVGRRAKNDDEDHDGVFMFADSTNADFSSTAANQFNVRASGGYRLFTNAAANVGVLLAAGGSSWSPTSDRNVKANFADVDTVQLLDALAGVPVSTWNLQAQPEEIRHIGPMAQDFNASFGYLFGQVESELHINTMDAVGVSLAASQGLYTLVKEQAEEIAQQAEEIAQLTAENEEFRARLETLEKLVQGGE